MDTAAGASDDPCGLRAIGVTAALLALAFVAGGCSSATAAAGHSCGALDKRFIETAGVNMTALGMLAQDYQSGVLTADEVAEQALDSAKRIRYDKPRDPSLRKAQTLIDAMFQEYGDAVVRQARGKADAGQRMYRAYGLANFARDVLIEAQPALAKRGCDVASLL
jgi:hypothetical protein